MHSQLLSFSSHPFYPSSSYNYVHTQIKTITDKADCTSLGLLQNSINNIYGITNTITVHCLTVAIKNDLRVKACHIQKRLCNVNTVIICCQLVKMCNAHNAAETTLENNRLLCQCIQHNYDKKIVRFDRARMNSN